MKKICKPIFALILAGMGMAHAQLNIVPNVVTFRTPATANNTTTHYGDLKLDGGSLGESWGWLYANKVESGSGLFYDGVSIYGYTTLWKPLTIYGDLYVEGAKHFIQPHPTDTSLVIQYVSIESGEALTLARGVGKTMNGSATIALPLDFDLVTSSTSPLSVQITPEGAPCLLFVKSKSKKSIRVEIKGIDFREYGDVSFSYQVTGVRDGYETVNPIVKLDAILSPSTNAAKVALNPAEKRREEFHERIRRHEKVLQK
jgi:hypothetical protein